MTIKGEFINLGSSNKLNELGKFKPEFDSGVVKKAINGTNDARVSISDNPLNITKKSRNINCLFLFLLKAIQIL